MRVINIKELFYADLRSLALFRVGTAILVLANLALRAPYILDFYTDKGFLPRSEIINVWGWVPWSIHSFSGGWQFEVLLFIISAIAALLLLAGYKTRVATIVSFLLLVSLNNRDPLIVLGGDSVLRLLLFWGIFLPWNARFSIDSITNSALRNLPNRVFSIGILGYFIQICIIYFFAALLKTGSEWTKDYTAVYYVLNSNIFATPVANILALLPPFLLVLTTYLVRLLEILTPFLLFFPFFTAYIRFATIILLTFMHLTFAAALNIGLFGFIDVVGLYGFIPSFFWDWIFKLFEKKFHGIKIYYDSECGLCIWVIRVLKTFFLLPSAHVIPGYKDPKINSIMDQEQSWIIEDYRGKRFFRSRGVIPMLKNSPILFIFLPLTKIPGIFTFGDKIYKFISHRRHSVCKIPKDASTGKIIDFSMFFNLIAFCFILYIVSINLSNIPLNTSNKLAQTLGVNQRWGLFAPFPPTQNMDYEFVGMLKSGNTVRLTLPSSYFFRNYVIPKLNVFNPSHNATITALTRYLCNKWNRHHTEGMRIKYIAGNLIFTSIRTAPKKIFKVVVPNYVCGKDSLAIK